MLAVFYNSSNPCAATAQDDLDQWQKQSYWEDVDRVSQAGGTVIGIIVLLNSLLSALGNSVLIIVKGGNKASKWTPNILLLTLSGTSLLFVLLVDWIFIANAFAREWIFHRLGCRYYGFMQLFLNQIVLFTFATAAHFQRKEIVKPKVRRTLFRRKLSTLGILWLIAFVIAVAPLVGWGDITLEAYSLTCSFSYLHQTAASRSFLFILVMVAAGMAIASIIFDYVRIHNYNPDPKTKNKKSNMRKPSVTPRPTTPNSAIGNPSKTKKFVSNKLSRASHQNSISVDEPEFDDLPSGQFDFDMEKPYQCYNNDIILPQHKLHNDIPSSPLLRTIGGMLPSDVGEKALRRGRELGKSVRTVSKKISQNISKTAHQMNIEETANKIPETVNKLKTTGLEVWSAAGVNQERKVSINPYPDAVSKKDFDPTLQADILLWAVVVFLALWIPYYFMIFLAQLATIGSVKPAGITAALLCGKFSQMSTAVVYICKDKALRNSVLDLLAPPKQKQAKRKCSVIVV